MSALTSFMLISMCVYFILQSLNIQVLCTCKCDIFLISCEMNYSTCIGQREFSRTYLYKLHVLVFLLLAIHSVSKYDSLTDASASI